MLVHIALGGVLSLLGYAPSIAYGKWLVSVYWYVQVPRCITNGGVLYDVERTLQPHMYRWSNNKRCGFTIENLWRRNMQYCYGR